MDRFVKVVNSYKLLTIFAKRSILHVRQGSQYASVLQYLTTICFIVNYVVTVRF